MKTLSIIIPCYNEEKTIKTVLEAVERSPVDFKKEIIIVDDCSKDGTRAVLETLRDRAKILFHDKNKGKGAALKTGFQHATGDIWLIQDADLEYSPEEYPILLAPILAGEADVVYGSRFVGGQAHRVLYFWHMVANNILTTLSNMCTNLNLTDMETCYKVFKKEVIAPIVPKLRAARFGFEPEITARIAATRARVFEVGISYRGRTYEEGKKINWWDGVKAVGAILYFNFFD